MSLIPHAAQSRATKVSFIILAAGCALAIASAVIPSTGAWFFAEQSGRVIATTAKMSFSVLDNNGVASNTPIELRYDGLAPGKTLSRTFTVQNTGSLTGNLDVVLSDLKVQGGNALDLSLLTYTVNGGAPFNLRNYKQADLGLVDPGMTKTVTITLSLSENAGMDWQDLSMTNALSIELAQAH